VNLIGTFKSFHCTAKYKIKPTVDMEPILLKKPGADWGPLLWKIFHLLAEWSDRRDIVYRWKHMIELASTTIPCEKCRRHMQEYLRGNSIFVRPLESVAPPPPVRRFRGVIPPTIKGWTPAKGIDVQQAIRKGLWKFHNHVNRSVGATELTEEEAWKTIEEFGTAAVIARDCGFGAVEVMGSEGYLVNQFLSGVTNHRQDFFGGTPEKFQSLLTGTWLPELADQMPQGETTTMTITSVFASTTNRNAVISVEVKRPDGTPVVTGAVKYYFNSTNQVVPKVMQTIARETSGSWKLSIAGLPAGTWVGNVGFKDASGTHAEIKQPLTLTIEQGPTPPAKPSKKPAIKPVSDGCKNQIKN
jgi:hypothetical protein